MPKSNKTPRDEFDELARGMAGKALSNLDEQIKKSGQLPLLEGQNEMTYLIMCHLARQCFSAIAKLQRDGADISPSIIPRKDNEPPSPL